MLSYSQNPIPDAAVCIHFKSRSAYLNPKHFHIYDFYHLNVFDHFQKTLTFLRIILIVVQSIC